MQTVKQGRQKTWQKEVALHSQEFHLLVCGTQLGWLLLWGAVQSCTAWKTEPLENKLSLQAQHKWEFTLSSTAKKHHYLRSLNEQVIMFYLSKQMQWLISLTSGLVNSAASWCWAFLGRIISIIHHLPCDFQHILELLEIFQAKFLNSVGRKFTYEADLWAWCLKSVNAPYRNSLVISLRVFVEF